MVGHPDGARHCLAWLWGLSVSPRFLCVEPVVWDGSYVIICVSDPLYPVGSKKIRALGKDSSHSRNSGGHWWSLVVTGSPSFANPKPKTSSVSESRFSAKAALLAALPPQPRGSACLRSWGNWNLTRRHLGRWYTPMGPNGSKWHQDVT